MKSHEFHLLDARSVNVKAFDCGKEAINTYLHQRAAKHMALHLNKTFILPISNGNAGRLRVAAYYTLAFQTLGREEVPETKSLPRYPLPVILLAQLGVERGLQKKGLGFQTLTYALRHARRIAFHPEALPAMGVVLDVLDDDAMGFYDNFDFFRPLKSASRLYTSMASLETLPAPRLNIAGITPNTG